MFGKKIAVLRSVSEVVNFVGKNRCQTGGPYLWMKVANVVRAASSEFP